MKKLYKFLGIIAIGAVIVVSTLALMGCDNGTNGCRGSGDCYFIRSSQDYKWCGDNDCDVYLTVDTGQASISCDCD
jgi:hypothetical protein